jgi:hypothetical protein
MISDHRLKFAAKVGPPITTPAGFFIALISTLCPLSLNVDESLAAEN